MPAAVKQTKREDPEKNGEGPCMAPPAQPQCTHGLILIPVSSKMMYASTVQVSAQTSTDPSVRAGQPFFSSFFPHSSLFPPRSEQRTLNNTGEEKPDVRIKSANKQYWKQLSLFGI